MPCLSPLTAALLLVSNIETVARTAERLIYSTEESTPRPEREEVASFVNTVQGLVTFTITVTNSEGKPQPNVTLQIKPSDEVKTFKTNAEGKDYHRSGYDDSQVCFPRRFLS